MGKKYYYLSVILENKQPLESDGRREESLVQIVLLKDTFLPCQFFMACSPFSLKEKWKIDFKKALCILPP